MNRPELIIIDDLNDEPLSDERKARLDQWHAAAFPCGSGAVTVESGKHLLDIPSTD